MKYLLTHCFLAILMIYNANAQTPITWKTYNHRQGYTIQLPDSFTETVLAAGGSIQWYDSKIDEKIQITVECGPDGTQKEMDEDFNRKSTYDYYNVLYSVVKPGWYVVSGRETDNPEIIFYIKGIIKNGKNYCLRIRYPEKSKGLVDPFLGKISASFK